MKVMIQTERKLEDLERRVAALEREKHNVIWGAGNSLRDRHEEMIRNHGEFVDKTTAARILGVTRATIYTMIADGRLRAGCAGKRVMVASIAAYLHSKEKGECTG